VPLTVALSLVLTCLTHLGAGRAEAVVPALPSRAVAGWQWPLQPIPSVLRGFRPPAQRWLAGHRGVDLAAAPGQVVHAPGAGIVGFAGDVVDRGVVVVAHGNLRTTYEPVNSSVGRGDSVTAGSVLGTVAAGSAHCPGATCLHWGLLRDRHYLNPMLLLRPGPVYLLPVWARGSPAVRTARRA
jgi:murein DD-endopeptidase MepM/ murein hydrolase activator NlpD